MQTTLSSLWSTYLTQLKKQLRCSMVPGAGASKPFKPRQAVHVQPGALRSEQQAETATASYETAALKFGSAGLYS